MLPVERRFRRLWHLCLALAGGDDAAPAAAPAAAAASSSTSSRQRPVQRKTVDDESTDGGDDANAPRSAPVPPEVAAAAPLAPVSAEHDLAEIMAALEADGCALIPGVLSEAAAGSLAALLAGYVPGTAGTGLTSQDRDHAPRRHLRFGGDCQGVGRAKRGELLLTLFNRGPEWLRVLDPSPVIEVVDSALSEEHSPGRMPHLVNMSGWRHHPGHNAEGSLHVDQVRSDYATHVLYSIPLVQPVRANSSPKARDIIDCQDSVFLID